MILSNPITVKELRSRMRGLRAILPIMAYLVVLAIFIVLAFAEYGDRMNFQSLVTRGRELEFSLLQAQLVLVLILAPAYAASAIAIEKERETFGVMQITLLTPWEIVSGKVFTGFSYAFLLVVSSLPLLASVIWMGGFNLVLVFWGFLIIAICAFVTTCVGILVSTIFTRSYLATGVTYAVILLSTGLGFAVKSIVELWHQSQRTVPASGFTWDTFPVWFSYTLNPFHMLASLDTGSVSYSLSGGYYANPWIGHLETWLKVVHLPYATAHVILSIWLGAIMLIFASYFLFRSSREDNP